MALDSEASVWGGKLPRLRAFGPTGQWWTRSAIDEQLVPGRRDGLLGDQLRKLAAGNDDLIPAGGAVRTVRISPVA